MRHLDGKTEMRYTADQLIDRAIEDPELNEFAHSLGLTDPRDVLVFLICWVQYRHPVVA